MPATPAKELAEVLDEEKFGARAQQIQPLTPGIRPANLLRPCDWNERKAVSGYGVVETVRRLDADEKAVARLNESDNLGKNSPSGNKVVASGTLRLPLLVVVHRSLNEVVECRIAPEPFTVYVGRPEKDFGQCVQSAIGPLSVDEALGNDVSGVLGVFEVLPQDALKLVWRLRANVVRLANDEEALVSRTLREKMSNPRQPSKTLNLAKAGVEVGG